MFKECIRENALCNSTANDFFSNIDVTSYGSDISFTSTLRALVAPRMSEGEELYTAFDRSGYTASALSGVSVSRALSAMLGNFYSSSNGVIYIHSLEGNEADNIEILNSIIERGFPAKYSGFHRLEKVTEFYKKYMPVMCFINPERKSVAIFISRLDLKKLHYLQCSIFAFLPWYFDPKQGVTELEMNLIESLREKTADKYYDCINKIAAQYDFRGLKIKKLLDGFEIRYEKQEIERVKSDINAVISDINTYNRSIGDFLRKKNEYEIRLLGLETKVANYNGDSEIMQYFLCNQKLELVSVNDEKISFIVKDYITYFDEDMAKVHIDNPRSYVYEYDDVLSEEQMKKLMYEIFINQTFKIKVCAAYTFDLRGHVNPRQSYNFGTLYNDSMPNPHVDRYQCMGDYVRSVNELLKTRNYIGAIEQCVASCKSLNFADSPVMTEFMKVLCGYSDKNSRCIELPNGNVVGIKDAMKYIEEQEVCADEQNNSNDAENNC